MKHQKLLRKARERIFFLGIEDLASKMSYENMVFGLSKLLCFDEEIFCLFGPDATITRNKRRWEKGFGYGCVVRWRERVMFPELLPNGCGSALVELSKLPSFREVRESLAQFDEASLELYGTPIKLDIGKGNHFFEFYEVLSSESSRISPDCFYAILHSSSLERKKDMYKYAEMGEILRTPFGDLRILEGRARRKYFVDWKRYENFVMERRRMILKNILDCKVLSNLTHQGMFGELEIRLGSYDISKDVIYPVTLRWDLPVYLYEKSSNLSEEVLASLEKRAIDEGVYDFLRKINILPHGGGYNLTLPYTHVEIKGKRDRYFVLKDDVLGEIIFQEIRSLPFNYRGEEVIDLISKFDLARPIAKLKPVMTLKV
ncbi:MAG: hypothetical protein ACE5K0_12375 [Candidatus Methanofastidiosia archaeon]